MTKFCFPLETTGARLFRPPGNRSVINPRVARGDQQERCRRTPLWDASCHGCQRCIQAGRVIQPPGRELVNVSNSWRTTSKSILAAQLQLVHSSYAGHVLQTGGFALFVRGQHNIAEATQHLRAFQTWSRSCLPAQALRRKRSAWRPQSAAKLTQFQGAHIGPVAEATRPPSELHGQASTGTRAHRTRPPGFQAMAAPSGGTRTFSHGAHSHRAPVLASHL